MRLPNPRSFTPTGLIERADSVLSERSRGRVRLPTKPGASFAFPFAGLWPLLVLLAGCECTPFGLETTRFTCATDADCASGFECRDLGEGLECVVPGAPPVDAGEVDAGELDAGEVIDSGVDAGELDAGPQTPPTQLRFATAPQSVGTGACSQVINVETLGEDGGVRAAGVDTTVSLESMQAGVMFFTASNCSGSPTTSVIIAAAQSSSSFYATAADAGTYVLTASAPPLTPATQTFGVQPPPTSLVFTSTPPSPVRGGTCLTAVVEARRGTIATPVAGSTTIGLTAVPGGTVRFYSDGACTTSTTTATMAPGAATATFFVKPLTAGSNAISATAPFGTANQSLVTTAIVRRGQCEFVARIALPDGGAIPDMMNDCTFSPPLSDLSASMLITQATAQLSSSQIGGAEVRCRLTSTNTVNCQRREDLEPASVHFQVAEIPQGMLVQRFAGFNCPPTLTLGTPVDPARSFVLKTLANSTLTFDDEDAALATLTGPTTVTLDPVSCQGHDVQVVDWAGLTVTRGSLDGGLPMGSASVTLSGLPPASNNRALLVQPGVTNTSTRPVCASMIRGAMPSNSSIVFTRAAGDAACLAQAPETVSWERLDFGNKAAVREFTATFAPGDTTNLVSITPVDTSRTIVFSGSQMAGGQGVGETDHDGFFRFTEGAFQLVLTNSNTVTVTRAETTSTAIVTFYVAELLP
jgi:hypothetical protein